MLWKNDTINGAATHGAFIEVWRLSFFAPPDAVVKATFYTYWADQYEVSRSVSTARLCLPFFKNLNRFDSYWRCFNRVVVLLFRLPN